MSRIKLEGIVPAGRRSLSTWFRSPWADSGGPWVWLPLFAAVFLFPVLSSCGAGSGEVSAGPGTLPAGLEFSRDSSWRKGLLRLESANFLVCSSSRERLDELVQQVEYIEKDLTPRLGSPAEFQRLEVWDIHSSKVWNELLQNLELRHRGVALQVENHIYLQPLSTGEGRHLALFHEWVHYAFWARGWRNLPLWAEEGVAQHYAWNTAQRYARSQRRTLTRRQQPVSQDQPFSTDWRVLLDVTQYPEDADKAGQVYQCSEYLVRAILRRLHIDQHARLWNELSRRPGQLRAVLNETFHWSPEDWVAMESDYIRFIQTSRNRGE